MRNHRWWVGAAFPCFLLLSACGPKESILHGKVTYQNKPLPGCDVIFMGTNGIPLPPATTDDAGNYSVKGVKHGEYFVNLAFRPKDFKTDSQLREEWKAKGQQPPPDTFLNRTFKLPFPSKYTDPATSGLTVTVSQATTQYDIAMTD